jgi:endonuclease/exonuclease/phosphatase family metal-dependent hydrolase
LGRSGTMLYQARGMRSSGSRNLMVSMRDYSNWLFRTRGVQSQSGEDMRPIFVLTLLLFLLLVTGALVPAQRSWTNPSAPLGVDLKQSLVIASLNLDMQTDPGKIARELGRNAELANADVLLLQEVVRRGGNEPSAAEALAKHLGRNVEFASPTDGATLSGIAILSRYRLRDRDVQHLKAHQLRFKTRSRIALAVTADSPLGAIRILNTHLDTRINAADRLEQMQPIIDEALRFTGPRIIGGDLNTNYLYWVGHVFPVIHGQRQGDAVRERMESNGFTTPFAFTGATSDFLGLRLDWVYLNQLEALNAGIQPISFSDHHAIWTRVVRSSH